MKKAGENAEEKMAEVRVIGDKITEDDNRLRVIGERLREILLTIPNIPADDVPLGKSDADNPEVVTDNFCNGYWLRSPMGNTAADSGYAYIVDLVNGMIRPEAVKPDGGSTDEELRVTTSIGVRPAFAVPQG